MQKYNEEDIKGFRAKDQRISWLSIFSSICKLEGATTINLDNIITATNKANNALYKEYPFVEIKPLQNNYQPRTFTKPEQSQDLKCDYCKANLVKTKDGSAFRCPNWKKDGTGCKGTYVRPGERERAMAQDSIEDEARHNYNEHPNDDIPPEFGER